MNIGNIILGILLIALAFCFYMLHRNSRVYRFVTRLGRLTFRENSDPLRYDWRQRGDIEDRVQYDDYMRKWWVPLRIEKWYDQHEIGVLREGLSDYQFARIMGIRVSDGRGANEVSGSSATAENGTPDRSAATAGSGTPNT